MTKTRVCATRDCKNTNILARKGFCIPCHAFITAGIGSNNQVVRNASALLDRRIVEKLTMVKLSLESAIKSVDEAAGFIRREI